MDGCALFSLKNKASGWFTDGPSALGTNSSFSVSQSVSQLVHLEIGRLTLLRSLTQVRQAATLVCSQISGARENPAAIFSSSDSW